MATTALAVSVTWMATHTGVRTTKSATVLVLNVTLSARARARRLRTARFRWRAAPPRVRVVAARSAVWTVMLTRFAHQRGASAATTTK